jgi:hypothetical protein
MQNKNLKNRIKTMEKDLTGEQLARIWMDTMDKVFDKKITAEEAEKEMELFMDTYTPMGHNTWVDWVCKKHELETNRLLYEYFEEYLVSEYFEEYLVSLDYKIAFLQQSLALIIAYQNHEDYITSLHASIPGFKEAWVKHCKEHPEDKRTEVELKGRLKEIYEFGTGTLLDTLSNLEKKRADFLKDSEIWDKINYPKPVSIFAEMEESEESE